MRTIAWRSQVRIKLAERRPGREGLGRQGNPWALSTHEDFPVLKRSFLYINNWDSRMDWLPSELKQLRGSTENGAAAMEPMLTPTHRLTAQHSTTQHLMDTYTKRTVSGMEDYVGTCSRIEV
ncbi:UNVERIFIED_CONTAM: hypothetical protein FKN15_004872 [Acipenser sinensis]